MIIFWTIWIERGENPKTTAGDLLECNGNFICVYVYLYMITCTYTYTWECCKIHQGYIYKPWLRSIPNIVDIYLDSPSNRRNSVLAHKFSTLTTLTSCLGIYSWTIEISSTVSHFECGRPKQVGFPRICGNSSSSKPPQKQTDPELLPSCANLTISPGASWT